MQLSLVNLSSTCRHVHFLFFGEVLFFDVRLICEQVRDVFERIASGPLEALPCKSMIPMTRKGGFGIYTDFST